MAPGWKYGRSGRSSLKAPLPVGGVKARQLDKTSKGAQTLSDALGTGAATSSVTDGLVSLDGTLTDGAADAGDRPKKQNEQNVKNRAREIRFNAHNQRFVCPCGLCARTNVHMCTG